LGAAVLSTALISLQFTPPDERAGARAIPDKINLGARGERLNANMIASVPTILMPQDPAAHDKLFQEFVDLARRH
jgi:hypothetical protein